MEQFFNSMIALITKNIALLSVVTTVGAAAWTVLQFAIAKASERRKFEFQTYHNLIKDLVQGDSLPSQDDIQTKKVVLFVDRQIATIFELRQFPLYYSVTERICQGLKLTWRDHADDQDRNRILVELDLTERYVKRRLRLGKLRFWLKIVALFLMIIILYKFFR